MSKGYIKLYRQSVDNPLYFAEKFTKWQAWIDLLMIANHTDRDVSVRGVMIIVKRGQALASERFLSDRWRWSRDKVRGFLVYLENKGQILPQKNNVTTLITITNYEKYQSTNQTTNPTTEKPQTLPTKECKELKNEKENTLKERIGKLFKRRETTIWDNKEIRKLKEICKRPEVIEELEELERFYNSGYTYKRKDLITFLNNWTGELDKSRSRQESNQELERSEKDDHLDEIFNNQDGAKEVAV
jgi:DNA replication protein DnaD